jgi:hypothetical protein
MTRTLDDEEEKRMEKEALKMSRKGEKRKGRLHNEYRFYCIVSKGKHRHSLSHSLTYTPFSAASPILYVWDTQYYERKEGKEE